MEGIKSIFFSASILELDQEFWSALNGSRHQFRKKCHKQSIT